MRIAIISTFRHPTRLPIKERSAMQSSAPELIAGLCPPGAEIEIFNEKENDIPLDRHWDLVFFSYLDPFYEHTKVLSTIFRRNGMKTVAGGRHASRFPDDCLRFFDSVVVGEPEPSVPRLIADFEKNDLQGAYRQNGHVVDHVRPYRYDLIDFKSNRLRSPALEASRGCPFSCSFCVLTGHETYRYRPVPDVIRDITEHLAWNPNLFGLLKNSFIFHDNNLGGSPKYLRELCEALIPLKKTWGCSVTFNVLEKDDLVELMARAGCRFIYTGLESLNPESLQSFNKKQNKLKHVAEVIRGAYSHGILLAAGLIVGADGDTNEYLERLPEYLTELKFASITFLGIASPFPGTPLWDEIRREGRMLPGVTIRDLDTYTVCHRPKNLHPTEVAEHYQRLVKTVGAFPNVFRQLFNKLTLSNRSRYKSGLGILGSEVMSIKNNIGNPNRTYIAGQDPIEEWDRQMMDKYDIPPQYVS